MHSSQDLSQDSHLIAKKQSQVAVCRVRTGGCGEGKHTLGCASTSGQGASCARGRREAGCDRSPDSVMLQCTMQGIRSLQMLPGPPASGFCPAAWFGLDGMKKNLTPAESGPPFVLLPHRGQRWACSHPPGSGGEAVWKTGHPPALLLGAEPKHLECGA